MTRGAAPARRALGTTGMAVSGVGFGAWAVGGGEGRFRRDDADEADAVAAIRRAVELGVNWIDTSPAYGYGRSERIVAAALAGIPAPDRPYVFTKCGVLWDEARPEEPPRLAARAQSIRRELDGSRRRLGVERIDLLQVHWPPEDGTPLEEYWGAMVGLRDEGRIGAAGLSNHDVAQLEAAEAVGHVDCLQPPFSLIARRAAADVIPWCRQHGTGVIVYSPMQSGLLSGSFSEARARSLPDSDWRKWSPDFQGADLRRNLSLADALAPVAARHGVTRAAVAVAWTLSWPGVSGAIVGARAPKQVDEWASAATLELGVDDLDEIAAAIERTGAGDGPTRPDE